MEQLHTENEIFIKEETFEEDSALETLTSETVKYEEFYNEIKTEVSRLLRLLLICLVLPYTVEMHCLLIVGVYASKHGGLYTIVIRMPKRF